MRLIACLSWYDEKPSWLAAAITSLHHAQIDHLIAVDGAYALLPEGKNASGTEQHHTIIETARALGIGLTLHIPQDRWNGDEVEKRTHMFRLAQREAEPRKDWLMIMDADQVLLTAPHDLKHQLAATKHDVASVIFTERCDPPQDQARQFDWDPETRYPIRILFRSIPGIRCHGNHYTYTTPDGRRLWGNDQDQPCEPALHIETLVIDHRTNYRPIHRHEQQYAYYKQRDTLGTERATCHRCTQPATRQVPAGWEPHDKGMAAGWVEACDQHAEQILDEGRTVIRAHGYDPDTLIPTREKVA